MPVPPDAIALAIPNVESQDTLVLVPPMLIAKGFVIRIELDVDTPRESVAVTVYVPGHRLLMF